MPWLRYSWFIILLLSGCKVFQGRGGDSNPKSDDVSAPVTSIPIFESKDKLPTCSKENDGDIAYVKDEKAFYSCDQDKWRFNSVKGEDGKPGAVISPIGDQWREVWKAVVASSVYIESKYSGAAAGQCTGIRYESGSGYIVDADRVVTNGHVAAKTLADSHCGVMNLAQVRVWFPVNARGDTEHTTRGADATVVRIDRKLEKDFDTLLLDVPTGTRGTMPLSTDGLAVDGLEGKGTKLNEDVLQIGFSGGTTFPHFATGKITQIAETENRGGYGFLAQLVTDGLVKSGLTVFEYDLVSGSGASGGAVLDLRGLVVATNFAGNSKDADTEFGYAIPISHVIKFLEQERVWEDVR
jgi:hypothetical protein